MTTSFLLQADSDVSAVVAWSSVLRRILRQGPGSVEKNGATSAVVMGRVTAESPHVPIPKLVQPPWVQREENQGAGEAMCTQGGGLVQAGAGPGAALLLLSCWKPILGPSAFSQHGHLDRSAALRTPERGRSPSLSAGGGRLLLFPAGLQPPMVGQHPPSYSLPQGWRGSLLTAGA